MYDTSLSPIFCVLTAATSGFKFSELEMSEFLCDIDARLLVLTASLLEAVLYMMLYNFKFAPSESPIEWKLGTVLVPYVKGHEDGPPHLPIKISPVQH